MHPVNPNLDRHDELLAPLMVGSGLDGQTLTNIYIGVQVDAEGVVDPTTVTPIRGLHTCETTLHDLVAGVSGKLSLNGLKRKLSVLIENQVEEFLPTVGASGQAVFETYDAVGGQIITSTPAAIEFDNVRINTDPETYVRTRSSITVLKGGHYEVEARITLDTDGNTRTSSAIAIFRNSVEEPGSRAFGYNRNAANGWATLNVRVILPDVQPGDTFEVRAESVAGGDLVTEPHGSSVSLRRLL